MRLLALSFMLFAMALMLTMPSAVLAGPAPVGCCQVADVTCFEGDNLTQEVCEETLGGDFTPGGFCAGGPSGICQMAPTETPTATPTSTPTETPTATPTDTPALDGALCAEDIQCASTFCADGVCCDTACTEPDESCNEADSVGECVRLAAPVPAASNRGLVAMGLTLVGLAAVAMRRRAGS